MRSRQLPSLASIAALIVLIVVLATGGGDDVAPGHEPAAKSVTAKVTRVVDGDTVEARVDGRSEDVRYIGVDTPESVKPDTPVECYAIAASHFNEDLVEGESVRLDFDAERRDVYGRLLAYVHLGARVRQRRAGPPRVCDDADDRPEHALRGPLRPARAGGFRRRQGALGGVLTEADGR